MSNNYENLHELATTLNARLEEKDEENVALKESLNDLIAENNSKDSAIAKATKVIDMLQQDLEKSWENLKLSESTKSKIQKELKESEKEISELRREINNMKNLKVSEQRAKNEKLKLKDELNQNTIEFEMKHSDLKKKFKDMEEENKRFQLRIESLQNKLKDNNEKLNDYEKVMKELGEQNKKMLNEVDERNLIIEELKSERNRLESSFQSQLSLIKREAENQIRSLESNSSFKENIKDNLKDQTARKKEVLEKCSSKTTKKSSTIAKPSSSTRGLISAFQEDTQEFGQKNKGNSNMENAKSDYMTDIRNNQTSAQNLNCSELLKITIEETLNREIKFYENLDGIFKKEAFYLQNNFNNLPELMIGLRPEVEKWRMRCEEMETKLGEYKGKMSNMSMLIRDFQKAIHLIKKAEEEEKKFLQNQIRELESSLSFLQIELHENNKKIEYATNLPCEELKLLINYSQEKITDLKHIQPNQSLNCSKMADLNSLLEAFFNFFKEIEQKLTIKSKEEGKEKNVYVEELIENPAKYVNFSEIRNKLEELSERNQILERENFFHKNERNNEKGVFERDKSQINEQINLLQENLSEMANKLEACTETILILENKNAELLENSEIEFLKTKLLKKKEKILDLKKIIAKLKNSNNNYNISQNIEESFGKIHRRSNLIEESSSSFKIDNNDFRRIKEMETLLIYVYRQILTLSYNYEENEDPSPENISAFKLTLDSLFRNIYNFEFDFLNTISSFLSKNYEFNSQSKTFKKSEKLSDLRREVFDKLNNARRSESPENNHKSTEEAESMIFLKEIFSDLNDISSKFSQFTSKIDERAQTANFLQIINDPKTVTSALDENIRREDIKFFKLCDVLIDQYNENSSNATENISKHFFNCNLKNLSIEKIQGQLIFIRNAIRILDISYFNEKNSENTNSEFYKRKNVIFNEKLLEILESNRFLKDNTEILNFEIADLNVDCLDPEILLKKLNMKQSHNSKSNENIRKNHIQIQLFDILRENIGFRMAANSMHSLLMKYREILEHFNMK